MIDGRELPPARRLSPASRPAPGGCRKRRIRLHRFGGLLLTLAAAIAAAPSHSFSAGIFERSALTAGATAVGGALVPFARGPASLFLNPAGMATIIGLEAYADYAEPRLGGGARETRLAVAGISGPVICGLGWYHLAIDGPNEDIIAAGAARTLITGTQGSYIAVGAAAVLGRTEAPEIGSVGEGADSGVSADIGVIVRPLPVLSFGYAAGNVLDADVGSGERSWRWSSRWGVAYFWENIVVLSLSRSTVSGDTKQHIGVSARTAVPIELMFGLSAGNAAGGVRWNGERLRAGVSFAIEENGGAVWMISCEGTIISPGKDDW